MLNRTIAPEIKNAVDFTLRIPSCVQYTLDNGVRVFALDMGVEEVVQLELVFEAGNSWEQQNLVAAATNHLLKSGTRSKTAFECNEHFDFYGSRLKCSSGNETASVLLHALSKNLPALLPVIGEMLSEAVFPEEELNIFKQNRKQKLAVNLQKCDFVADRLIDAKLYGENHPYGKYSTMEGFDALNRDVLLQFYNQHYRQGKCMILIAGRLPQNIAQLLNEAFGKLLLRAYQPEKKIPAIVNTPVVDRCTEVVNDAQGVQGAIRIARNFPNRHLPEFQKVLVLNNLFGGFFGSRLMSNIREDKGYTYGIHSYVQNHIEKTAWMISTEAGRDVCKATIQEVYYEMERLCNEPVDAEELLLVKNFMLGAILGDMDSPFEIMNRWKNYLLNGTDDSYFYAAMETIRAVTAQEVQELANTYLKPEYFYELVVI